MGTNRIETQVSGDLYHREMVGADNALPFLKGDGKGATRATQLNQSRYTVSLPAQRPPQPKGSAGYFEQTHERTKLNFIEQLAGFELTPGETFILGGLFVLASPMLAVGMLAGCERDLIPKAPPREGPDEALCGGEKCELPNAISACLEEQCRIDRCLEGFSNANGLDEDGCECNEAEEVCNHAPVLEAIGDRIVNVGEELHFIVSASDPDGDPLIYTATELPAGAGLDADTGEFNWAPTRAQIGNHEITFEASDGSLTARKTISIEVRGVGEIHEWRITNNAADSRDTSLVWADGEYGVSWFDWRDSNPEIYFARIDAEGNKIGGDVRITNDAAFSQDPSLVWTGSEYGVSWSDDRDGGVTNSEIYFARIDASGNKIGSDVRITNAAVPPMFPSLVWTGTEYGVSWHDGRDGNSEIYFARIDASGNKIGSDVRITNDAAWSYAASLVWTGMEYGVSWYDDRDGNHEIYFARIDASGNKLGQDVRITYNDAVDSGEPSLVWTGTEYGVSWRDTRDGNPEIYFARIDSSGNKLGTEVRITNAARGSYDPSLVWTGGEYGVSWRDHRDGNEDIYFARIDAEGNKIGSDVQITNDGAWSRVPSLVWTGTEYGVSWYDYRDGNAEIYFARIIGNFTP